MKGLLYAILFGASMIVFAQHPTLIRAGSIEFEKRVNRYALFRKAGMPESWYDSYTKQNDQFFTSKSNLLFSANKTLFIPMLEDGETDMINSKDPFPFSGQNNIVYTDLENRYSVSKKKIYEKELIIKDSLQHIKWKLTNEFREVSGYRCRRANGLIMDSVYVVAFYTNEIHYSGGPESFSGLPGMILEVFLPHDNVSCKALKVTAENAPQQQLAPPSSKIETINRQELAEWAANSFENINIKLKKLLVKGLLI